MKPLILNLAGAFLVLSAATALADEERTTTTTVTTQDGVTTRETVTTSSSGTLTDYAAGTRFIVRETSGPVTYNYGNSVVYATRNGRILTPEEVQARIRIGLPVNVHYVNQGDTRVIHRVIIDD